MKGGGGWAYAELTDTEKAADLAEGIARWAPIVAMSTEAELAALQNDYGELKKRLYALEKTLIRAGLI